MTRWSSGARIARRREHSSQQSLVNSQQLKALSVMGALFDFTANENHRVPRRIRTPRRDTTCRVLRFPTERVAGRLYVPCSGVSHWQRPLRNSPKERCRGAQPCALGFEFADNPSISRAAGLATGDDHPEIPRRERCRGALPCALGFEFADKPSMSRAAWVSHWQHPLRNSPKERCRGALPCALPSSIAASFGLATSGTFIMMSALRASNRWDGVGKES